MKFFFLQTVGLNVYIFLFSVLKMNYSKTFSGGVLIKNASSIIQCPSYYGLNLRLLSNAKQSHFKINGNKMAKVIL